jgi:N6-L-threonylcarbamoyladenine synthase
MLVLGVETSCDECAAAVVEDGRRVLSSVIATQIEFHREFYGVVPEIASRLHTQWIGGVVNEALLKASVTLDDLDGFAVTSRPGLLGSLMVGLSFIKTLSWMTRKPFVAIDHIKAHIYAARMVHELPYPHLGLIVSGGHTLIVRVDDHDTLQILGRTIDDACGEAFDKIAKFYDLGYPGGVAVDRLAAGGDPDAFRFPQPKLDKRESPYDISYSGLKTAVINQRDQFLKKGKEATPENLAASFQKAAIGMLVSRLVLASEETGITDIAVGGGVSANRYLRQTLGALTGIRSYFPPMSLCTDNGAMIGGLGFEYLKNGVVSPLNEPARSRVIMKK